MLELKNISKRFGEKQIISDLNLKVPEKQILAIVGPSGGGKTTLLRMLAGLETIDSGDIIYNGEELPLDELEKRNLLGFVFQDFQLFPHLTVLENLTLSPIKTKNFTKEDAEKKETEAASGEKVKVTLLVTGSFGDKAFNDSAQAGMKKIESEMGDQVEVEMIEMGSDKTKFEGSMLDAAESDADIIRHPIFSIVRSKLPGFLNQS